MTRASKIIRTFAVADLLVLAYLLELNVAVLIAPPNPRRTQSLLEVMGLLLTYVVCLGLVRTGALRSNGWTALLYRIGIYGTVQQSYVFFKHLLPVVNPGSVDRQLFALDHVLFGFEPAVWADQFVGPLTTEWFAFFYFCYFFLLAAHIFPIVFGSRDQLLLGEFMLGMLIIVCIGHTGYILVPGFGPFRAFPELFKHELPSGLWMDLVWSTVRSNGAQKDIFPSLHTAGPCFIALFSFRNRDRLPFRYTWPLLTFFSANIIGATMFLRWHYVIDVFAGFTLAVTAALVAPLITRWEVARRRAQGLANLVPVFGAGAAAGSAPENVGRAAA
ncbi:MAG: phosphatase PAP2 family protein [Myxococcales bacterium]